MGTSAIGIKKPTLDMAGEWPVNPATTPTALQSVPDRTSRAISTRWHEWDGRVLIHWGGSAPPGLERAHWEHMVALLARGIPLRAIRRLNLDDPRQPRLVLMARAERYLETPYKLRKRAADAD
jgi:hypothetical protein